LQREQKLIGQAATLGGASGGGDFAVRQPGQSGLALDDEGTRFGCGHQFLLKSGFQ